MRNKNVVINIPADGLAQEICGDGDYSYAGCVKKIKRYIREFLFETPCGRIFLNICYKRSVVPSDTADSYLFDVSRDDNGLPLCDLNGNVIKTLSKKMTYTDLNHEYRELEKRGINIIEMAVEEIKKYNVEVWFSLRMNDHHFPDDKGFNSSFSYDRASRIGVKGSRLALDYTNNSVQNYYRNYIKELFENYDIDGVELDFLRSCPVMTEVNDENMKILTGFVCSVKKIAGEFSLKKIKPLGVAVRVYPKECTNLEFGIDAVKWICDGIADIITVEGWYIPTFYDIPVDAWRKNIDERNINKNSYTLLCGTDWAVMCDRTPYTGRAMWISLEQFKGFVSSVYSRGADGIYIFNHFNTNDDYHSFKNGGLYTYYIDENGNETKKRVLSEKIRAADSYEDSVTGMRCYVHTYTQRKQCPYPICIDDGKIFEFDVNTCSKPECGVWNVIIGTDEKSCGDALCVEVNGLYAKYESDIPAGKDFSFAETEEVFPIVNHVSETARRVMKYCVDLNAVKDGFNKVKISSKNNFKSIIKWIEIQVQ